jgi:hypothetical protein
MSVKAEMAFDVCWELYRQAREVLKEKRGVAELDLREETKFLWRPDSRPKLKDWVADFALAGQTALERPERASRMVMFRLYYLGLTPYERARYFGGLSERGWVNWSEEIRRRCGEEIVRRGMFRLGSTLMGTRETPNARSQTPLQHKQKNEREEAHLTEKEKLGH